MKEQGVASVTVRYEKKELILESTSAIADSAAATALTA
jgi:hypothetical protein